MIEKTNIMIGPKMGASPNTGASKSIDGIIIGDRSLQQLLPSTSFPI